MKYRVLTHLNHDNNHYDSGDEIELSSAEADPLLKCKAIEPLYKPFTKASTSQTSEGVSNV